MYGEIFLLEGIPNEKAFTGKTKYCVTNLNLGEILLANKSYTDFYINLDSS